MQLPFGGAAIDATGEPLPAETLEACRAARAVLLGAVGGPRWDGGAVRPEQGLLGLRKALDVYANLRPATQGDVDLLIVRELVGGLYFGARGVRDDGTVFDTCEYHPDEVDRIVRRGFELARGRRRSLVSVDKANVLDTSRMWRRVVDEVAPSYPDVELRHALVDSFAMELVNAPETIDVVVTENTFGDILSDVAAAVTGGLGLAASASLGDDGPGSSSRCTARRPTSPAQALRIRRRCCARSPCCSSMRCSAARSRGRARRARSTRRSPRRRHPISAATPQRTRSATRSSRRSQRRKHGQPRCRDRNLLLCRAGAAGSTATHKGAARTHCARCGLPIRLDFATR